jgi:hypothetical protein
VECVSKKQVREEISQVQIEFLSRQLYTNLEKIKDYNKKCDLLTPYGIGDILRFNKIAEEPNQINFGMASIFGMVLGFNKLTIKAHSPQYNKDLLDILITREISERKSVQDLGRVENKQPTQKIPPARIMGIIHGDFKSGDIIVY